MGGRGSASSRAGGSAGRDPDKVAPGSVVKVGNSEIRYRLNSAGKRVAYERHPDSHGKMGPWSQAQKLWADTAIRDGKLPARYPL